MNTSMQVPSAADLPEAPLSRLLFGESPACRPLAAELRIAPGSCVAFEVPTATLVPGARGPGDIDVLVSSLQTPARSLAIELKRVKVTAESFDTELPGKLSDLKRGVQQANLLGELGFHRTYLVIAIVTDGRQRVGYNFFGRGPTVELLEGITQFTGRDRLRPGVGLAFVDMTQPIDKDIALAGSVGAWIEWDAQESDQPPSLTASVAEFFRTRAAR